MRIVQQSVRRESRSTAQLVTSKRNSPSSQGRHGPTASRDELSYTTQHKQGKRLPRRILTFSPRDNISLFARPGTTGQQNCHWEPSTKIRARRRAEEREHPPPPPPAPRGYPLPAVENVQKGIKTTIKILHHRTCSHHRAQTKTWRGRKLDIRKIEGSKHCRGRARSRSQHIRQGSIAGKSPGRIRLPETKGRGKTPKEV